MVGSKRGRNVIEEGGPRDERSNRVGNDVDFPENFLERGPRMSVDSEVLRQKSDGGFFLRRIERDHSDQRLVPLSADPNRTNPLLSLTRTGRNHCEESSYSQRSPISSFYCPRFRCVVTRVSVLGLLDVPFDSLAKAFRRLRRIKRF